jgi:RNA polymerase sigma factor (sigma-70 family)
MNFNITEIRTMLHFVTKRTGTPIRDEDLEQEVALHALAAFRRLGHVAHPRGLLRKIVHDTVRDHWRHRQLLENLDSIDERFISQPADFELALDLRRRLARLDRALCFLPPRKRNLLELFYSHGHSISEIARLRGRSVSAIKMELLRSRQALARIMERRIWKLS